MHGHGGGFVARRDIEAIRQELATAPIGDARVELATIARMGGTWQRRGGVDGGVTTVVVTSTVGAVVRRITALAAALDLPRPGLEMRARGGVRTATTWAARLDAASLSPLGVVTDSGAPRPCLPDWTHDAGAAVRAVVLVSTSVSGPSQPAHMEITPPSAVLVADVVALFDHVDVRLAHDQARGRLVCKSGPGLVHMLTVAGATQAAEAHMEHRNRRDLRNKAVRLTNADAANVGRAVQAAGNQVDVLVVLRDNAGWETVPEHLRQVALARLANPTISMADVGTLCDPPVGKSTVHRRMAELRALAERAAEDVSN